MWFEDILPKIGIPGVVISIFVIAAKISPITFISSSWIEMRLSTKEKRFYIKLIRTFLEILFYLIFLLMITATFFSSENIYNSTLVIIFTCIILGLFIWILILDLQGKTLFMLINEYSTKWKIIIYSLFFLQFIGIFVLPSYYFGTQIYSQSINPSLTKEEQLGAFIAIIILFTFYIFSIYFTVIKTFYRFLGFDSVSTKNLVVKVDDEIWYIFHPIEKGIFILGNKSTINESTEMKFIEKTELLKKRIEVKEVI